MKQAKTKQAPKRKPMTEDELKLNRASPSPSPIIKCIYSTRLVIPATRTPTGKRYEFMSGEEQPVDDKDYDFLLSLKRDTAEGCCSGSPSQEHYYFEAT